jgi:polyvinyl alcohol dehydrogenase (cytochrome)
VLAGSDGGVIFAERCAHCHSSSVIEPGIQGLAKLDADTIYRILWKGVMREAANGLDDAQRRAVAEYVNTRHADNVALSRAQIKKARLKWAFVIPDTGSTTNAGNQATYENGRLYVGSRSGFVFSLDAQSGCVHWVIKPEAGVRSAIVIADDLAVFADYENHVYAVDAWTGALRWKNKADEQPSARVNGSVVVHQGVVYVGVSTNQEFTNALDPKLPCCTFRGTMTAFDMQSGKRLWQTRTIEEPLQKLGRTPSGTMQYGPSGGGLWSVPTIDSKRGLMYVGTSNQKTGPPVDESDAVIAFDLKSGSKTWVRSFAPERYLHGDIWNGGCVGVFAAPEDECPPGMEPGQGDRDIGSPIVVETRPDGSEVLLVATKDGVLYAVDPDREGEIIWETRVGRIMSVVGPSFGGVEHGVASDGKKVYVPISDVDVVKNRSYGAMLAVDLMTGEILWRNDAGEDWCEGKPARCHNSISSPPTVVQDIVFAGATDGVLRAYDTQTGEVLWQYDTVTEIKGVNGLTGRGGSITRGGTTVINGMFFQSSGYGQGLGMPGNVLYAFEYPKE